MKELYPYIVFFIVLWYGKEAYILIKERFFKNEKYFFCSFVGYKDGVRDIGNYYVTELGKKHFDYVEFIRFESEKGWSDIRIISVFEITKQHFDSIKDDDEVEADNEIETEIL